MMSLYMIVLFVLLATVLDLLISTSTTVVYAYDNGVGLTPPMGWNSWNHFHCDVSEELIKETATALVTLKLHDLGYQYVNIDDCWQTTRNESGYIVEDPDRFSSGIGHLSDYIHTLDTKLKFGLYSDSGIMTCQRRPGGLGHEIQDATMYAAWNIDYLKYDNCFALGNVQRRYERMHTALNLTGHTIFFSMCEWGVENPAKWAKPIGNSWRTTDDISPTWYSIMKIVDQNDRWHDYAGPGGWNDPDMLEVGNGKLTYNEQKAHFTLWCLIKSPLLLGNDLRNVSQEVLDIITNQEVIALNQDPLGIQGYKRWSKPVKNDKSVDDIQDRSRVQTNLLRNGRTMDVQKPTVDDGDDETIELWAGDLDGGDVAVVLLNRSSKRQQIIANFEDVGIPTSRSAKVRDLWAHQDLDIHNGSVSAMVESHDVAAFRLSPVQQHDGISSSNNAEKATRVIIMEQ